MFWSNANQMEQPSFQMEKQFKVFFLLCHVHTEKNWIRFSPWDFHKEKTFFLIFQIKYIYLAVKNHRITLTV